MTGKALCGSGCCCGTSRIRCPSHPATLPPRHSAAAAPPPCPPLSPHTPISRAQRPTRTAAREGSVGKDPGTVHVSTAPPPPDDGPRGHRRHHGLTAMAKVRRAAPRQRRRLQAKSSHSLSRTKSCRACRAVTILDHRNSRNGVVWPACRAAACPQKKGFRGFTGGAEQAGSQGPRRNPRAGRLRTRAIKVPQKNTL